ncbi:hypothetical protein MKW94_011283 [Papaver nudicaule]|uniref:Uncharacterized protein n=1 Tax=Papaver nudicaule TaxID=74823 RepID=A0AA41SJA1_PAPNU|nr:hypothetical protein [Papaver nudicaule]
MEKEQNISKKGESGIIKKGQWKPEEDLILKRYIETHGEGKWTTVSKKSGLMRGAKSCRMRWKNHLRPNIKRGQISEDEEDLIIRMHKLLGNRWSLIAGRLPGRTDNEVKNYWNTHLSRRNINHYRGQTVITTTINCTKSAGLIQMNDLETPSMGTTSTHENCIVVDGILGDHSQGLHNSLNPDQADVQSDITTTTETQPTSSEQRSDAHNESTILSDQSLISGESDNMEGCTFPDFPSVDYTMISEDEKLSLWLSSESIFYDAPLLPCSDYYFPVSYDEPFEHNSDDYYGWNKYVPSWL